MQLSFATIRILSQKDIIINNIKEHQQHIINPHSHLVALPPLYWTSPEWRQPTEDLLKDPALNAIPHMAHMKTHFYNSNQETPLRAPLHSTSIPYRSTP